MSFFHFLNSKNIQKFQLKRDKDGSQYYMKLLQKISKQFLSEDESKPFNLLAHHLSFNEQDNQKRADKHQYHYRADFKSDGKLYCLHVYFDFNDQITRHTWKVWNSNSKEFDNAELDPKLIPVLRQFASEQSRIIMHDLRNDYEDEIAQLESQHRRLKCQLEALNPHINRQEYEDLFALDVLVLEKLSFYNSYYKRVRQLYAQYKISSPNQSQAPTQSEEHLESSKENKEMEELQPQPSLQEIQVPLPLRALSEWIAELTIEVNDFQEEAAELSVVHLDKFLGVYAKVQQLMIELIDSKSYQPTCEELQKVSHLFSSCIDYVSKLLPIISFEENAQHAEALKGFAEFVSNEIFLSALENHNAGLLQFLLTNATFPLERMIQLYLSKIQQFSAADEPCLKVLVHQHASIFLQNGRDGLPIAYSILRNEALTNFCFTHIDKMEADPQFMYRLRQSLMQVLDSKALDSHKQKEIQHFLEKNMQHNVPYAFSGKQRALAMREDKEIDRAAQQRLLHTSINLQDRQEIHAGIQQLKLLEREWQLLTNKKTTKTNHRSKVHLAENACKQFDALIQKENLSLIQKKSMMQALHQNTNLLKLKIQLEKLSKNPSNNKQQYKLDKKRIEREISQLENQMMLKQALSGFNFKRKELQHSIKQLQGQPENSLRLTQTLSEVLPAINQLFQDDLDGQEIDEAKCRAINKHLESIKEEIKTITRRNGRPAPALNKAAAQANQPGFFANNKKEDSRPSHSSVARVL